MVADAQEIGDLPAALNLPIAIFDSSGTKMCDNAMAWTGV